MPGSAAASPRWFLDCRGRALALGGRIEAVGILNVTPDSFFDGGRWDAPAAALAQLDRLAREGAAAIDVGGQSTRPGHAEVSPEEELARVLPVLRAAGAGDGPPLSIDTYRAAVARAALAAGAHLVNDIHGFQGDPHMPAVVAEAGCPAILMHHDRGFPGLAGDPIEAIKRYFERSLGNAAAAAIPAERLILDPGIGFFKSPAQNLEILRRIGELRSLGRPLLLGASRKSIIGRVLGEADPAERLEGTLAITVLAAQQGVALIRVHDVRANLRAARMAEAILPPAS
jgi:dihydropteroate synthase